MRFGPPRPGHLAVRLRALSAWSGLAALAACGTAPREIEPVGPIADFARLVGGEWQVTFANGTRGVHAWRWGPGKHSLCKVARASGGAGGPWAGDVLYWDPRSRRLRMLSLHEDIPGVGRGVGAGTIAFAGDTATGTLDLMQPRGLRKLGLRWTFPGADRCRDVLLEDTGSGFAPLAEWEFTRVPAPAAVVAAPSPTAARPAGTLRAFAPLLDDAWLGPRDTDGSVASRWTFAWIPSLDVVWVRRESVPTAGGEPTQLLEAWVHPPIGSGPARCLVVSHRGDVHDGEVHELAGGGLRFDLDGWERGEVVRREVHLALEPDGTLRQRVWSLVGAERSLVCDLAFRRVGQERGGDVHPPSRRSGS